MSNPPTPPERSPLDPNTLVGISRDPLTDGRQSERALAIQRGTCRLLQDLGWAPLAELTLASARRADIAALSEKGDIWIVEIKSSIEDFRSDHKWQDYLEYCDQFSFAVNPEFPMDLIPPECGLIVADNYGAEIIRSGEVSRLNAARRKAMTIRFARHAARRLRGLLDPGSGTSA